MPGGGGKGGGSTSSTVTVNNGPIDVDSTVEIKGLDDIGLTAKIDPIELKEELRIPDPIVTKSDSTSKSDLTTKSDVTSDSRNALSVDLKPVVLDVCSTTMTKLPHGEISQPFQFHFGLTLFGTEYVGFNIGGESRTILRDLPKRPAVDWPAQQNAAPHTGGAAHGAEPAHGKAQGLRIRIK
jgi:hypothetical protein